MGACAPSPSGAFPVGCWEFGRHTGGSPSPVQIVSQAGGGGGWDPLVVDGFEPLKLTYRVSRKGIW